MNNTNALSSIARSFEDNPSSVGIQLSMNLSEIVVRALDERGWSQKQLAEVAGTRPAVVNRVVHAENNCTFELAGRLLFALGLTGKLVGIPKAECRSSVIDPDYIIIEDTGASDGNIEIRESGKFCYARGAEAESYFFGGAADVDGSVAQDFVGRSG